MVLIDLQNDENFSTVPSVEDLLSWVTASLQQDYAELEQTLRIVGEAESRELNRAYRGKDNSTNVLSFASAPNDYLDYTQLGDLVICAPVVEREALQQHKTPAAHWAHMVVHGVLHLRGFDHQDEAQAQRMEDKEREVLDGLGFSDPYAML